MIFTNVASILEKMIKMKQTSTVDSTVSTNVYIYCTEKKIFYFKIPLLTTYDKIKVRLGILQFVHRV